MYSKMNMINIKITLNRDVINIPIWIKSEYVTIAPPPFKEGQTVLRIRRANRLPFIVVLIDRMLAYFAIENFLSNAAKP